MSPTPPLALQLHSVTLQREGSVILDHVDLTVSSRERWLVLGANGSGKTSLVRIAALYDHPTSGRVEVLGETLGSTDVRELRRRIGYLSAAFAADLRPQILVRDVVMTARTAALETWWHTYDDSDRRRALACLEQVGIDHLSERQFGSLSSGEQQRVLLARVSMNDPGLVLLDEPSARLDLGGRETLVQALTSWTHDLRFPPLVIVTHHLDEVPSGMTHVLMLKSGRVLSSGPIERCLDSASLSECFEVDLRLERRPNGRYSAWSDR